MNQTAVYLTPGISTGHCQAAIIEELAGLDGIKPVVVDLEARLVRLTAEPITTPRSGSSLRAFLTDSPASATASSPTSGWSSADSSAGGAGQPGRGTARGQCITSST